MERSRVQNDVARVRSSGTRRVAAVLRRRKWMWVSWASAVLERWVRVVSSFGVEGGAGRRWIVSGRARKSACRRDQRVSCHLWFA
jgi:hypothetical protein